MERIHTMQNDPKRPQQTPGHESPKHGEPGRERTNQPQQPGNRPQQPGREEKR